MILVDTNVLARMTDSGHPHCAPSRRAVHLLFGRREQIVIVPQNLYEFWAVATRSASKPPLGQNGLGMACDQARQWLRFFQRRFMFLPDRAELPAIWQTLVHTHGVKGFKSHDARLVAAMQSYGISSLLSFNASDFKVFAISIIDPASL